jgi:hypothetical protein
LLEYVKEQVLETTLKTVLQEINVGPHVRRGLNMAPMAIQFRDSTADQGMTTQGAPVNKQHA